MNKKAKIILEELYESGILSKYDDLLAGEEESKLFSFLISNYGHLLSLDPNVSTPDEYIKKGDGFHKLLYNFGGLFLSSPQVIENKKELLEGDNLVFNGDESVKDETVLPDEPVIFVGNHHFKDDTLATLTAIDRRMFIIFGSLPQFYNTFDGILAYNNGVVMVNRKVSESRKSSIGKGKKVLEAGRSLLVFPEGVWHKKPNGCMLPFWNGFYKLAQKEDGSAYKIVPIVHYINNTYEGNKENKIHTVIDNPIDISGMNEEDAINYIYDRMQTWYYKLMEKYGTTTREELLKDFNDSTSYFENELEKRVGTTGRYDLEIELSADKRKYVEPLDVYENLENVEVTKENAKSMVRVRKYVNDLKRNDFQHRY